MWANSPPPSCTPQVPKLSTSALWEGAHLRNGGRSPERGSLLQSAQKCPIAPWGHQLPLLSVTRMTAGPLGRAATSFLKCPQLSLCFHCKLLGSRVGGRKVCSLVSLPGATRLCSCISPSSERSPFYPYGSSRLRAQAGSSRRGPGSWPWLPLFSWSPVPAVGLLDAQPHLLDPSSYQGPPPFTVWKVLPGSSITCHTEKGSVCATPQVTRDLEGKHISFPLY